MTTRVKEERENVAYIQCGIEEVRIYAYGWVNLRKRLYDLRNEVDKAIKEVEMIQTGSP